MNNRLIDEVLNKSLNQSLETNANETIEDVFKYLEEIEKENASTLNIDTFDYTAPEGSNYVLVDKKDIKKILDCISNIIDLNSPRAVSRGISIRPIDNTKVDIICPNPVYYYKTTEDASNTLEEGTIIFVEYLFLTKIAKFLPPRILIYSKDVDVNGTIITKYFIRLTTGDLELINTTLIGTENGMVNTNFKLSEEPISILDAEETYRKFNSILRILPNESDSKRRVINVKDGRLTFYAPTIFLQSKLNLPNTIINMNIGKYIRSACRYADEDIAIYKVIDEDVDRYAIVVENMVMITILRDAKDDSIVTDKLSVINATAKIDYIDTKYNLDYITSIIYAIGNLYLKKNKDLLTGTFKLHNGSSSNITLRINGYLDLPDDKSIRVSSKSLLFILNALDSSLDLNISYEDGILFLLNSDVKIALVTI